VFLKASLCITVVHGAGKRKVMWSGPEIIDVIALGRKKSVNIDHYSLSFLFFSFQVMLSCSCQLYEPIPLLPVFLRLTFIHLETILPQCIPAVDRPRSACARERQKPRSLSVSLSICFLRYQFPPKYVCAADLDY